MVRLLAVFLIASLSFRSLAGQSPAERAAIDSFRTALAADSDTADVLAALTAAHARLDTARKDPVLRTELGWALLRAGQLLGSADTLYAAADEFYHAIEHERHWPYAWFGLGNADIALEVLHAYVRPSVHQPAGAAWVQTAAIAFAEALKRDPTYTAAALALAKATLANNFDPQTSAAVPLLHSVLDSMKGAPEPFLLLGRLEWRLDSLPAARQAFRTFLRLGGDSGTGLLELARVEYAMDEPAAAESAYYAGAVRSDTAAIALYRADLSYIADSADLTAFDSAGRGGDLSPWLRQFWERRDAASGQRAGHRLAEHYRRYHYAMAHYHNWARIEKYDFMNVFRSNRTPFDDRGVIYIRQGPPDRTTFYANPIIPPNESWLYFRPGGNLVLHFAAGATTGWKLIENLASIVPFDDPDPTPAAELLASRADFSSTYRRLADLADFQVGRQSLRQLAGKSGGDWTHGALANETFDVQTASVELRDEYLESRRAIQVATTTDADPLRFPQELPMVIQAYGAGGAEPGMSRLLVVYALPDLRDVPYRVLPDSSVVYALRLRVQAADSLGHLAVNTDSVRLIHAHRPLTKGQTLTGLAVLTVPRGDYRAKVMVADSADSIGGGWALSDLPAPDLSASTLTLSDPILGRTGSGLAWARDDGLIPLNPLNTFPKGAPTTLSYELGGLAAGQPYTTRLTVRKFGSDSTQSVVALSFNDIAAASRQLLTRGLDLGALPKGRYLLTVRVTQNGVTVERTRRVVVGR